jgi:hypothetical protein
MPIPVQSFTCQVFLEWILPSYGILVNRIYNGNTERPLPKVALSDAAVMLL